MLIVRLTQLSVVATLLLLPFFFGGVHLSVYLPYIGLIGGVACLIPLLAHTAPTSAKQVGLGSPSLFLLALLSAWLAAVVGQRVIYTFQVAPHPLLDAVTPWVNFQESGLGVITILGFLALFGTTRWLLGVRKNAASWVLTTIAISGGLIGLTALGHWFSDDGRLFGYFSPDHVFKSSRARWPFVNSNSLGHFLITPFFVSIVLLQNAVASWRESIVLPERYDRRSIKELFFQRATRRQAPRIAMLLLLMLIVLLAILGSLSRGAWLGLAVGISIVYIFLIRNSPMNISATKPRISKRRSRPRVLFGEALAYRIPWVFSRVLPPLLILLAILFFLSGRGMDLVEGRLEYALMSSKDDLRWVLYQDSVRMFWDSPWLGIGFANWLPIYSQYASPQLAGINPEYLHSDPLQMLVEMGLIGSLPMLVLLGYLLIALLRILRVPEGKQVTVVLLAALTALATASCLDFPFRIPAITFQAAITLALTAFYLDRTGPASVTAVDMEKNPVYFPKSESRPLTVES